MKTINANYKVYDKKYLNQNSEFEVEIQNAYKITFTCRTMWKKGIIATLEWRKTNIHFEISVRVIKKLFEGHYAKVCNNNKKVTSNGVNCEVDHGFGWMTVLDGVIY